VLRSRLYVDTMAACVKEPGDLVVPLQRGELTEDHIIGPAAGGGEGVRVCAKPSPARPPTPRLPQGSWARCWPGRCLGASARRM
jgi:hypothetical protein